MAQNRFYSSVAFPTFLTSSVGASGNPQVASIAGLPGSYPYTVLIDWGLSTQEAISVTSAPTGGGPYTLPCTRGIDGTTAQAHSQNAVVVHGVSAQDYNEPQVHMSLNTSGTGINVVHGLANGSSVVGTTDSQTLTNKTLGAWTGTGDVGISVNDNGPVVTITQQNAAPTNSNLRLVAQAAAQPAQGIRVTGDTVHRYQIDSNGRIQWGAGGASAVDTNLYRNAAGELKTDTAMTVLTNLAVAGVPSLGSGAGVLSLANAGTAPTTNPTNGAILYGVGGGVFYRDSGGSVGSIHTDPQTNAVTSGILAATLPQFAISSPSVVIGATTGTVYMVALWIPAGTKVTNVNFVSGTTAVNTPTHWWVGISDSTGKQQAHSADQTTTTTGIAGTRTLVTKAMVTPYTTTYSGTYYALISMTATANATLSGIIAASIDNMVAGIIGGVSASTQTTPGTDNSTIYTLPAAAGGIPFMYIS